MRWVGGQTSSKDGVDGQARYDDMRWSRSDMGEHWI